MLPLRVIESDQENRGPSYARNAGVRQARGEIIFFTDDDVTVTPDWIRRGLPAFDDEACVGIEGRIVYVSDDYRAAISDRQVQNVRGGLYMTANAAYRRYALVRAGLFDLSLRKYQDRDLALRVMKLGNVRFTPECVVYHQRETYTYRSFMAEARKMRWWAELCSKHRSPRPSIRDWIYRPDRWVVILFPPALLGRVLQVRVASRQDLVFLLLTYPRLILERYHLWSSAIRHRVVLI